MFSALEINSALHERLRTFKDQIFKPVVRVLIQLHIPPNTVTILGLIIGLLSIPVLFINYWAFAGLLLVSTLADGIDGTLARTTKQVTDFGKKLDYTTDFILMTSVFIAVALWLQQPLWYIGLMVYGIIFLINKALRRPIQLAPGRMYIAIPIFFGWPVIGLSSVTLYSLIMGFTLLTRRFVSDK